MSSRDDREDLNSPELDKTLAAAEQETEAAPALQKTVTAEDGVAEVSNSLETLTPEVAKRYRFQGGREAALVGRGGIGRVLVALDDHLGREIAVKELLAEVKGIRSMPPVGDSPPDSLPTTTLRFLREARITAQLEHPNIVPVYELGLREDGSIYYTMKLVRGRTLAKALGQCDSLRDRLAMLGHYADLCQAMAYAHSRGVIHRDIKPDNVMVGEFGETVVLDWGLAKVRGQKDLRKDELSGSIRLLTSAGEGETVDGSTLGTPAYMPPEQARGEIAAVDERSDVWSLGAVLYQILTGRPPFTGPNAIAVMEQVQHQPVPSAQTHDKSIPPELASIADKALRHRPEDRYRDATALVAEIQAFESGARVSAYGYTAWDLIRRFVARYKAATLAAVVALLVLIVGAVLVLLAYQTAENERTVAVKQRSVAEKQRAVAVRAEKKARAEQKARERAEIAITGQLHEKGWVLSYQYALIATDFLRRKNYHKARFYAEEAQRRHKQLKRAMRRARGAHHAVHDPKILPQILSSLYASSRLNRVKLLGGLEVAELEAIVEFAISRNGEFVAAATAHKLVVWRLRSVKDTHKYLTVPIPQLRISARALNRIVAGHPPGPKYRIAFDPRDRWLDLHFGDQRMRVDLKTKKAGAPQTSRLTSTPGMSRTTVVSANGTYRLTLEADGSVTLEDAKQSIALQRIDRSHFVGLAAHPLPNVFLTAATDGTVYFWRILRKRFYEKPTPLFGIGGGAKAQFLSPPTIKANLTAVHPTKAGFLRTDLREDGTEIRVSRQSGKTTRTWKISNPTPLGAHALARRPHLRAAVSPSEKRIAFVYGEREVRILDANTGAMVQRYRGHQGAVTDVRWSPDGRLVTTSWDGTAHLWDPSGKKKLLVIKGLRSALHAVAIHPKGGVIATGGQDGSVKLYSSDDGTQFNLFSPLDTPNLGSPVTALRYSPDGRMLVAGTARGLLVVWDRNRARKWLRFLAHDTPILLLTYHPTHRKVCSSTARQTRCWPILVDMKSLNMKAFARGGNLALSSGRLRNFLTATPYIGPAK